VPDIKPTKSCVEGAEAAGAGIYSARLTWVLAAAAKSIFAVAAWRLNCSRAAADTSTATL